MYRTMKATRRRRISHQLDLIAKTVVYGVPILLLNHVLNLVGNWVFGPGWGIM